MRIVTQLATRIAHVDPQSETATDRCIPDKLSCS